MSSLLLRILLAFALLLVSLSKANVVDPEYENSGSGDKDDALGDAQDEDQYRLVSRGVTPGIVPSHLVPANMQFRNYEHILVTKFRILPGKAADQSLPCQSANTWEWEVNTSPFLARLGKIIPFWVALHSVDPDYNYSYEYDEDYADYVEDDGESGSGSGNGEGAGQGAVVESELHYVPQMLSEPLVIRAGWTNERTDILPIKGNSR